MLRCLRVLAFDAELRDQVEVIVVYDGQPVSEWAAEIAEVSGVTLRQYSIPKAGPAAARNVAASHASASRLIFCDSDVIFTADAVRAALSVAPGELMVPRILPELESRVAWFFSEYVFAPRHDNGRDYAVSAFWAMNKADFTALGGFDERYVHPAGEDMDFMIRWNDSGRRLRFAEDLIVYHLNPTGIPELMKRAARYGRHGNDAVLHASDASKRVNPLASLARFAYRMAAFSFSLITGRGGSHVHSNRLLTVIWIAAWQYGQLTRRRVP